MASYAANSVVFTWKIAPQKILSIQIPSCWGKNILPPEDSDDNQYGVLSFSNQCQKTSPVDLLKIGVNDLSPGLSKPNNLSEFVKKAGQVLLLQGKREQIILRSLQGQDIQGYYFTLSNRAVRPRDYRYITQGGINLKNQLLLFFTYLHNENDQGTMQTLVSALESVKLSQ